MKNEDDVRAKVQELDTYITQFNRDLDEAPDDEPDAIMIRTELRDLQDMKSVLLWVLDDAASLLM
jgi:hypothetical protein